MMSEVKSRMPAAQRKEQIITEAMRLAAALGPDRMTTQKLADAVGVSQAAIFRHFPSKTEIWQAVAERIGSAMPSTLIEPEAPATERLRAVVKRQFEFIVKTPAIPAILYSRELHAENDLLRARFSTMVEQRHMLFAGIFAEARDAGDFSEIRPEDGATIVLALIQGLAMRWSLENRGFDLVAEGTRLLDIQLNLWKQA